MCERLRTQVGIELLSAPIQQPLPLAAASALPTMDQKVEAEEQEMLIAELRAGITAVFCAAATLHEPQLAALWETVYALGMEEGQPWGMCVYSRRYSVTTSRDNVTGCCCCCCCCCHYSG